MKELRQNVDLDARLVLILAQICIFVKRGVFGVRYVIITVNE